MAKVENDANLTKGKKLKFNCLKASGQDWFYHSPNTGKTENPQYSIPVSQIPGIGDLDKSPIDPHGDIRLRRKWIRETDSKYVRLAKEGGRKDLFNYREHKPSSKGAVPYPRVDWFDHRKDHSPEIAEEQNYTTGSTYRSAYPEWYVHEVNSYRQAPSSCEKADRQIIAFDDMSHWKREAVEEEERQEKSTLVKYPLLPKIRSSKLKPVTDANGKNVDVYRTKFPEVIKKKEEGHIGQLLSMQYQREWLDEQNERKKTQKIRQTENIERGKEKVSIEQKSSKRNVKDTNSQAKDDKNVFKLSRYVISSR